MKEVMDFISLYRLWISAVIATIVLILLIIKFWDNIKFWWLCTWTSFPLMGTIARSYKQTSIDTSGEFKDWFKSEKQICSKFYSFYAKYMNADRDFFETCESYLAKVNEKGRKDFPTLMWIVIFLLVVAEAMGFAYVLAGYTIPGASESLQQKGAIAIAFVISIILVGFTHFTGAEIHKNSLIKEARDQWESDKNKDKGNFVRSREIILSKNNEDDKEPNWKQTLNRLNTYVVKRYITIITAILIVLIAVGATYVRGQVLEKQLNQEISNISTNVYESAPAELGQIQANADKKALIEQQEADKKGGWATFIILAVLFVFIQILGILFGYFWGFAGTQSAKAYKFTKGYPNAKAYVDAYKKKKELIAVKADEKLDALRTKMTSYLKKEGINNNEQKAVESGGNRNFRVYVVKQDTEDKFGNDGAGSTETWSSKQDIKDQPVVQNTQGSEPKQPATSVDLKEVQERVDELNDFIEAQISKGDAADMAKLEKYKAELNKNLEILIAQTKAEIADKLARNESFDELNEKLKEQLSMLKAED